MAMDKKTYNIVFTGILLIFLGFAIYFIVVPKSNKNEVKKNPVLTKVNTNNVKNDTKEYVVKSEKPKGLPLHFVYDVPVDYEKPLPHYVGTKCFVEELDNFKIVCASANCERQILTSVKVEVIKCKPRVVKTLLRGDVLFTKGSLKYLKPNVRIIGDLYIKDIDFLEIPKNFDVIGDIYLINSDGLTFLGKNFIDGNIYVSGKSSIRALPYNLKMTGQIFI